MSLPWSFLKKVMIDMIPNDTLIHAAHKKFKNMWYIKS